MSQNSRGTVEIVPDEPVASLSWGCWRFRWTCGFDVEPGGGIEIVLVDRFPTNRWSTPQTSDPTAPGYVTVAAPEGAIATVEVLRWPSMQKPHGATLHIVQVGIGGRTLTDGEVVEIIYGDARGGSLGSQVQLSARTVSFPVFISSGQEPKFLERFVSWNRQTDVATLRAQADFCPSLLVTGADAAAFHVVAPMEVGLDQPFALRISVVDGGGNAACRYQGSVDLLASEGGSVGAGPVEIDGVAGQCEGIVLRKKGFHRIHAIDPNRGILGVSNPIRVVECPRSIYWGEMHGHSEQSDGNGTPDEHYRYARDAALLDFACVTDHDDTLYRHPDRWQVAQNKVREYSAQGEFLAILGYEGRMVDTETGEAFGDINVYYATERGDMLEPFPVPLSPELIGNQNVILVPHTPLYGPEVQMGTHWEYLTQIPADLMPLVEIFSTHGNSEYYDCPRHVLWQATGQSVIDALKKGFLLGFIGSSDYHEVLTGSLLRIQDTPRTVNNRHMQARCGLAAVYAENLSRESLFDAFRSRRTFATSGIRAYVDFSVNGCFMGGELDLASPTSTRHLSAAVAAPERIVRLEIVKNGTVLADRAENTWAIEIELMDDTPLVERTFYYVRITTERNDFAWSSPIWVVPR